MTVRAISVRGKRIGRKLKKKYGRAARVGASCFLAFSMVHAGFQNCNRVERASSANAISSGDTTTNPDNSTYTLDSLLSSLSLNGMVTVYRSYSSSSGDHLFTLSQSEANSSSGYTYEGVVFFPWSISTVASNLIPIYRCSVTGGGHFVSTLSGCESQVAEGALGYVATAMTTESPVPLYRCYNPTSGRHLITLFRDECTSNGFNVESTLGYVSRANDPYVGIFRAVSQANYDHLITASDSEAQGASGYTYEGWVFNLFARGASGRSPIYRCYIPSTGDRFVSVDSECEGQNKEGLLGYVSNTSLSATLRPLYRCYNPQIGRHLTSVSSAECTNNSYNVEWLLGYIPQ